MAEKWNSQALQSISRRTLPPDRDLSIPNRDIPCIALGCRLPDKLSEPGRPPTVGAFMQTLV